MKIDIRNTDALSLLRSLPDSSVDLIATDPPYFRVKDEAWDRQWAKPSEFVAWLGTVADEWRRVLKPNGSLYCFASPQMAARVEVMLADRFAVLGHLVWRKETGRHKAACKEALRAFFPASERIIFCEQPGSDLVAKGEAQYVAKCDELRGFVFEPLRAYLDGERERVGLTAKQCDAACGNQMSGHYFTRSQWTLPTRANYDKIRAAARAIYGAEFAFRREYEDLRREYEDLRREYEDLRRPFFAVPDAPYTDVWTFPVVPHRPGKHVCEKPSAMMEHIVRTSSRPGAVVLDCFMGSGTTGVAAARLGRSFIGCDMSGHWCESSRRRIDAESRTLFGSAA